MVIKATQFIIGFAFFGDPVIQRALSFVNRFVSMNRERGLKTG